MKGKRGGGEGGKKGKGRSMCCDGKKFQTQTHTHLSSSSSLFSLFFFSFTV